MLRRRLGIAMMVLAVMAGLFALGGWAGHRATVLRLEERGEAALAQAGDRLQGQIDRYRYLPAVLSQHPQILAAVNPRVPALPEVREAANRLMERVADTAGVMDIYLMDTTGLTVASSNWMLDRSFIGRNFAWRPYFQRAAGGSLGFYHAVGTTSGERGFYFAHPVRDPAAEIIGVITVKLDLERMEAGWRSAVNTVFFTDDRGVIFVANRYSLILRALSPDGVAAPRDVAEARQYAGQEILPLPADPAARVHGLPAWSIAAVDNVPEHALWLSDPMETLGLTANVLIDTSEAWEQAALWGGLVAAVGGLIALAGVLTVERRNALTEQLATEERAKARLEEVVRARTEELSETNAALRAEIEERVAAEAALREVQDQLVQTAKLKALGEMSAGISHELNQPLSAIQTLADNGEILMERGREAEARGNLARISELASRTGRIIRNLRAFARNEAVKIEAVDIVGIVADAIDITAARLRQSDVALRWTPPSGPMVVRGGRVRLQQVLINLISNAADAMAEQAEPRAIEITLSREGAQIALRVRDTGPGLKQPDRVFDPFYTTKEVGEGLGLGLSISYGILQSFGGAISGETAAGGGAVFTVVLPAAEAGGVAA